MRKNEEKRGVGRALVRKHKQLIQISKEKGYIYRHQHNQILQSVTDVNDIDAIINAADEAARLFSYSPIPNLIVDHNAESSSSVGDVALEERREQQKKKEEEALYASSLRVPRRPPWNAEMSKKELDTNEERAFVAWRRGLASLGKLILTPFETNLDIWRQLWRVVERSDMLVMVVDARNPLFYCCPDLEAYAREVHKHRQTLLLLNKADLLPLSVREKWAKFFKQQGTLFAFWSAKAASAALEEKNIKLATEVSDNQSQDTRIYNREELLEHLQTKAQEIGRQLTVGFVGYPNVGKSSTINALVGKKRTGVTSTPGKTKNFQTLEISKEVKLYDCPGLVFPSISSSRYEMIACGVLPIDWMRDLKKAVQVVANRVPRHVIEGVYNIILPKPKSYEPQNRPPQASELLRAFCSSRGYVVASGLPDENKAGRIILKDYIGGKLPHFELPPGVVSDEEEVGFEIEEEEEEPWDKSSRRPNIEQELDELSSFDVTNGLSLAKVGARRRKETQNASSHKQHKKPRRKKDRSWRVGNDGGDGMPVVRVCHKPVNTALKD